MSKITAIPTDVNSEAAGAATEVLRLCDYLEILDGPGAVLTTYTATAIADDSALIAAEDATFVAACRDRLASQLKKNP